MNMTQVTKLRDGHKWRVMTKVGQICKCHIHLYFIRCVLTFVRCCIASLQGLKLYKLQIIRSLFYLEYILFVCNHTHYTLSFIYSLTLPVCPLPFPLSLIWTLFLLLVSTYSCLYALAKWYMTKHRPLGLCSNTCLNPTNTSPSCGARMGGYWQ
jgi:hypothetical protein